MHHESLPLCEVKIRRPPIRRLSMVAQSQPASKVSFSNENKGTAIFLTKYYSREYGGRWRRRNLLNT